MFPFGGLLTPLAALAILILITSGGGLVSIDRLVMADLLSPIP